jgi:hypothetical protein
MHDDAMSTGDDDRPTLIPPFNVEQYARDALGNSSGPPEMPTVVPPPTVDPARAPMSTLSDDAEMEAARIASLHSASSSPPSAPTVEVLWTDEDEYGTSGDPLDDARARMERGDFEGAMAQAEPIVRKDFSHAGARAIVERCERELMNMYSARIGSLRRVPRILVKPQEMSRLALDHRAGFLIALVDGVSSIETILDMSGMPAFETLRTLLDLEAQGVLTFGG